jgi:hypothetical protein
VHESVLVPVLPNVTLVGDRAQLKPVLGETLAVSVTVPVNPWIFVTNTVEIPDAPAFTMTLAGLTVTEKSWTTTATFAEWDSNPEVPVTVTV